MTRDTIIAALGKLSDELKAQNLKGEICLFGGTAMVLAYSARISTKDVDALFQPTDVVRKIARQVGDDMGLGPDWLNDGVKGFVSSRHELTEGNLPQFSHLQLTMPVAEYLFAMKCMAARIGGADGGPSDVSDIRFLIKHLAIKNPQQALEVVAEYYPENLIPIKTQYLLEGIFAEKPL